MDENYSSVQPLHDKAKDTFFKKVYESPERLKGLAEFLLGKKAEMVEIRNIRPVLYGNKENDLAFACDDVVYVMMEEQSRVCQNLPFRITEYVVVALRDSVDMGKLLYGTKRVMLPFPKLYGVNVGVVRTDCDLPESVMYEMRLSDSFKDAEEYVEQFETPDLEAIVHIYDFRMTRQEIYFYLKDEFFPKRFDGLKGDMFRLLMERGVFVDLFRNKEVCDMTVAQFSRDEMLIYQGREEGIEQGIEQGRTEGIRLTKSVFRLDNEGYAVSDIAAELHISVEEVQEILEED